MTAPRRSRVGRSPWLSDTAFTPATDEQVRTGLLGFVSATIDGVLRLDGIAVRRTLSGRLALSFPERIDRRGRSHPIVRPTCDRARREIEAAVLAEIGLMESSR